MTLLKAVEIIKEIKKKKIAIIKFIKRDKTERIMRYTLDFSLIPKSNVPKSITIENILKLAEKGIIRVYDLDKAGWRSIPFNSIEFIG
jgi:hypothetical protein